MKRSGVELMDPKTGIEASLHMAMAAVTSVLSGLINNQQHSYSDWHQIQ